MSGSVPNLACGKRLRSCDSSRNIQSDDGKKGKVEKMRGDIDGKVKNMNTAPVFLEKKDKEGLNNNSSEKKTRTDGCKKGQEKVYTEVRYGKASPTSFEKEKRKEKLKVNCSKKNMQNDHGKKWTEPTTYVVNKKKMRPYESTEMKTQHDLKHKKKDVPSNISKEQKMKAPIDSNYEKRKRDESNILFKKAKRMQPDDNNKIHSGKVAKKRPYESTEMKMQHDLKHKKRDVPSNIPKEKKRKAPIDCNYEKRKREESNILSKKVKRMQPDDNEKEIHSGNVAKKNCDDVEEKKRNTLVSFFKILIRDNFKESLSIPWAVAPELEDLTNHDVYLEDSEGKFSKIRLSVVDGVLAFHHGWNNFVSDHLIKRGEFLLFEYTAKSTFSVRIFGMDSCERLHFDAGRKSKGVGKEDMHTNRSHGDLISFYVESKGYENNFYVSGEYPRNKEPESHHVTVDTTTKDPKRVERMVGSGPLPPDTMNRDKVIQPCRTQDMYSLCSKGKKVNIITDSGSSKHENNIVKLMTSTADSGTQHVVADMKEHPKSVQNGTRDQQSTLVGEEKVTLTDVDECRTNFDAAPLTHENDETSKDDIKLHDSDFRRKREISSINFECTPAVNKYNIGGETNANQDICRNYEAPGGFRCLEKWRNSIVRDQAVLDGNRLIKPESAHETGSKFVVEYGAVGLNPCDKCFLPKDTIACSQPIFTMPIKDPARPENVSTCEHDGTEINHIIDWKGTCAAIELQPAVPIKNPSSPDRVSNYGDRRMEVYDYIDGKGTIAKLETKMGHLEPMGSIVGIRSTNIHVCANNTAARQSEHSLFKQKNTNYIDLLTSAKPILTPVKPEILESDDCSVLKVNMQFCIPNTTLKWLELPKSLYDAVRGRKRDGNVLMLKDPMKRLWPVLYHENSMFVGFTTGWKHFAEANNLETGDLCELSKESGDEWLVYSVQVTKNRDGCAVYHLVG